MNNLLILGAGQHGNVAKETAELTKAYNKIIFLDDNSSNAIDILDNYKKYINDYSFFVAIGNNDVRKQWIEKLKKDNCKIVNLINPSSFISPSAKLGEGIIVEANVTLNTNAKIDDGCILSIGCKIDHDSFIGKYCHIETGSIIMPNIKVEEKSTIINVIVR